jgi:hypothetical protein
LLEFEQDLIEAAKTRDVRLYGRLVIAGCGCIAKSDGQP